MVFVVVVCPVPASSCALSGLFLKGLPLTCWRLLWVCREAVCLEIYCPCSGPLVNNTELETFECLVPFSQFWATLKSLFHLRASLWNQVEVRLKLSSAWLPPFPVLLLSYLLHQHDSEYFLNKPLSHKSSFQNLLLSNVT